MKSLHMAFVSLLILSILSVNLAFGSTFYSDSGNDIGLVQNNRLVTKYVVSTTQQSDADDAILDIYQKRAIDNPLYLKYNSLESLKLGYRLYTHQPVDMKECITVKGYHGPSFQGFKAAVYRTECIAVGKTRVRSR
jgi:hypothetical protein